jgi:hypothetical protein
MLIRRLASVVVASTLSLSAFAALTAGPAGITTQSFGSGGGGTLSATWNATAGGIDFKITGAPAMAMGFVAVGSEKLSTPLALPSPPFAANASLLVKADGILPLIDGTSGTVPVPPIPSLVGMTFDLQGITIDLSGLMGPMPTIFNVTQGLELTFN